MEEGSSITPRPSNSQLFFTKMNKMRAEVLKKDWSDDKMMRGGGMQYPYLSTDKMFRNISPLFVNHGLEFIPWFEDVQFTPNVGNLSAHWTVRFRVKLVDIDTGYQQEYCVYGEASDALDKGLIKAETYAVKKWITTTFLISDGIEMEGDTPTGSFKKVTPEEAEAQKQKVKEQPTVVLPKKKEAPAPVVPEKPKAEPPKAPAEPQATGTYVMSEPHRKAIEKIIENWGAAVADGRKTKEEVEAMMAEFSSINNVPATFAFIKKYSKV